MESTEQFEESNEELVTESCGPFGDYYVSPAKVSRSRELRAALAAVESAVEMERRTR